MYNDKTYTSIYHWGIISGDNENKIDKYFDNRPQLKRPSKGSSGYLIDSSWRPLLESLLNKIDNID